MLQDRHQWPLALWAERTVSGWQKNPLPTCSPTPDHTQKLTLLLVVFLPGLGVVLLWGCSRLLGLLA